LVTDDRDDIDQWLDEQRQGNPEAFDRLIPLVYGELRRLAQAQLRREGRAHSLQPTLLVHEAFLRLAQADIDWQDRTHFLSVAARIMRRVLVEHARALHADKRGGGEVHVTLSDAVPASTPSVEVLALDEALQRLRRLDARQARAVELCYFGGLTYPEIGQTLGVSEATVHRDLRHAKAWLRRELAPS
jgi:RNA polymerase sigma factor (TIGR02999 family)